MASRTPGAAAPLWCSPGRGTWPPPRALSPGSSRRPGASCCRTWRRNGPRNSAPDTCRRWPTDPCRTQTQRWSDMPTVSMLQCSFTPVMVKWFIADRGTVVYMGVVTRRRAQRIAASPPFLLNIHCGYERYMERNDLKVPPSSPEQRRTRGRRRCSW